MRHRDILKSKILRLKNSLIRRKIPMAIKKDLYLPFSIICLFLTVALLSIVVSWAGRESLILETEKKIHSHFDFVIISANLRNGFEKQDFSSLQLCAQVYRNGLVVKTVGRKESVILSYNSEKKTWEGKWPVPWNADEGIYEIRLISPFRIKGREINIVSTDFKITRRIPSKMPDVTNVLTYENTRPFETLKIRGPDGQLGSWRVLLDWTKELGANNFWMLLGQTSTFDKRLKDNFPWNTTNIHMIKEIAIEAHKRGLKLGSWVACYYTVGNKRLLPNYDYAWEYNPRSDRMYRSRGISIGDTKRIDDLAGLLRTFNSIPEIDYIGLDYIRTTKGGYELVEKFIEDMDIKTPDGWSDMPKVERMRWLARIVTGRKKEDIPLIQQWNWWRARQICLIIKEVKRRSGITKPLWAFILSWEKGWQHGQDTVMFTDAGIDVFAVMLYEATGIQFAQLIKEWNRYIKKDQVNLIVGNQIDWPLHQYTKIPSGPEEFSSRLWKGTNKVYKNGLTDGAFIHDLSRALWGRIGPYSSSEWLYAGASIFTKVNREKGHILTETDIAIPDEVDAFKPFDVSVIIRNISEFPRLNGEIEILTRDASIVGEKTKEFCLNKDEESVIINFKLMPNKKNVMKGKRNMVVAKTICNNIDCKKLQPTSYDCKWYNMKKTEEYKKWVCSEILADVKIKLIKYFNIDSPFYYASEDERVSVISSQFASGLGISIRHIPYIYNDIY